jgi:succinylarginine dihydrolase
MFHMPLARSKSLSQHETPQPQVAGAPRAIRRQQQLDPRQVVTSDLKLAIINQGVVLQDVQDDLQRLAHRQRIHIADEFGLCTA